MSQRSLLSTLGPIWATALCLSGCSFENLLPKLAKDAGDPTRHVQAVLHPSKTRSLPPGIEGVRIEVVDVLLRRKSDDSWNILNDQSAVWSVSEEENAIPTFSAVPLPVDTYTAIRVVFGRASVIQNGEMQELRLKEKEITKEATWELSDDQGINLWLDLTDAISRGTHDHWEAQPKLEIKTVDADFASESLGNKDGEGKEGKDGKKSDAGKDPAKQPEAETTQPADASGA